jgi:adenylate cyclase
LRRSTADQHNGLVTDPDVEKDHEHVHEVDAATENAWRAVLTGDLGQLRYIRAVMGRIPSGPRCKLCLSPLKAPGSVILKPFGFGPSRLNRRLCRACFRAVDKRPGGAEIELSLMFADVRGSTSLAEKMQPQEFSRLISRFYGTAARVVDEWDGIIDKFVGDEAVALFVPGFAGEDHASRAVQAARSLIHETGNDGADPWVPLGIGVHTGIAYVGRPT